MTGANEHQIRWADEQLRDVNRSLDELRKEIDGHVSSPSTVITQCQQCIEISAKSIFKLMGYNFPTSHDIELSHDRTQNLLQADFPEHFAFRDEVPRVMFLTQFWHEFYETSKYGNEEVNLPPSDLFEDSDAEKAYQDARQCYKVANSLKETIKS